MRAAVLLTTMAIASWTMPASAQSRRVSIAVSAPAECAQTTDVASLVVSRIPDVVVGTDTTASLRVEVTIARREEPPGWHADIRVRGRDGRPVGERALVRTVDDCRMLDEDLGLVVALTIDAADQAVPREASEPPPPSTPVRVVGGVGLELSLEAGHLPTVTAGVGIGASFRVSGVLEGVLRVAAYWPSTAVGRDGRVDLWRGGAGVDVCPIVWQDGGLAIGICGSLGAGMIYARGQGLDRTAEGIEPIVDLGGGLVGYARVSPDVALRLELTGSALLVRPRFVYDHPTDGAILLHQPAPASIQARFGGWLHFGS